VRSLRINGRAHLVIWNTKSPEYAVVKDDAIDDVTTAGKLFAFEDGTRLAPDKDRRSDVQNLIPINFCTGSLL